MAFVHKDVHGGARWTLVYGRYHGEQRFAVDELQRVVQRHLPYVLETCEGVESSLRGERHLLLAGTPADNVLIAELVSGKALAAPEGDGGYSLAALESPWGAGRKVLAVAGSDPAGVLHGVTDLNARVLTAGLTPEDPRDMRKALDEVRPFALADRPAIENRGIWTWGYVIYDYRRFIDNMARLKMNMLIVWNDCAPVNAADIQ